MASMPDHRLPFRLRLRLGATWAGLLLEEITRALWPALALLLLALALALFNLPQALPGWLHAVLLGGFALGFLWLAWRGLKRLSLPSWSATRARVEAASGLPHRPLTAALDSLPPQVRDPQAQLLFRLHQARAQQRLAQLRAAPPRPVVPTRDPIGLGAAAALLLVAAFVVAGDDWGRRLQVAAQPRLDDSLAVPATLDAWLDPPDYTALAPIYLGPQAPGTVIQVPAGTQVLAQVQGGEGAASLLLDGAETAFEETAPGLWKLDLTLEAGETLAIRQGGETLGEWSLAVMPDAPPTAAFREPPGATERQALTLSFEAADDYGLVDVKLEIRRSDAPELPPLTLDLAELDGSRKTAAGRSYRDLTAHLWAGFPVELTLVATDALGQEGRSQPHAMTLPERIFMHPVARALVELRRQLTLDPEDRLTVARQLDQIFRQPQAYHHDTVVAVGIAMAAARLVYEREARGVQEVQSLLWDLALRLEDGDITLLANQLRDVQERLREALENGASDEEIEALMQELEQLMQQYLQALMEEMQRQLEQGAELVPLPEGTETIQGSDLQEMLEKMRELAQSGAREQAMQMLEQLQQMLENLQANPMQAMDPEAMQQMQEMLQKMEELVRRQQELLEQSQQQGQGEPGETQQGEGGDSEQQLQELAEQQEQLRRQLGELMRELANQLGDIPENLGEAEQAMRRAAEALEQGDAEGAAQAQAEALEKLQQGQSEMAQMMLQQMGLALGQSQGQGRRPPGESRDPLGRDNGQGTLDNVDRIDLPSEGELSRAREILEELRRRLDDPTLPPIERDYIERLLEQF